MEFVQGRERHYEEEDEEIIGDVAGKIPFPSSSSSSPSSQYKGAIPQPNGRWGAEAYDKHQRVWLGKLDSDEAAVTFNDRTAVEFRGRDTVTKFNQKLDLMSMSQSNTSSDVGQGDSADAGESSTVGEREHMFDKVVTPSDVGKLNRLVIPKQHAEKYFPLDTTANEKGLLLNFEDRSGKPWRFRYSYWNSSQSYVMTKGWSRFVKEKKLDAGDIVSFERGVGESFKDRLYIDWRHRPHAMDHPASFTTPHLPLGHPLSLPRSVPWNRLFLPTPTVSVPNLVHFHHQMNRQQQHHLHHPTSYHHHHHPSNIYSGSNCGYNVVNRGPAGSYFYLKSSAPQQEQDGVVQQGGDVPIVIDSVPVVHGNAAAKRVRLFGVNLECPISEQPECDILSSTTMASLSPQLTTSVHPLQLRLYNGAPLPTAPAELPNNRNQSLSFNLDT